jgi:hypothetical protein
VGRTSKYVGSVFRLSTQRTTGVILLLPHVKGDADSTLFGSILSAPNAFAQREDFHELFGGGPVDEGKGLWRDARDGLEGVSGSPELMDLGSIDKVIKSITIRAVDLLCAAPDAPAFMRYLELSGSIAIEVTMEAVVGSKSIHLTIQSSKMMMSLDPFSSPLQWGETKVVPDCRHEVEGVMQRVGDEVGFEDPKGRGVVTADKHCAFSNLMEGADQLDQENNSEDTR